MQIANRKSRISRGFTLIELLLVIAIIAVLLALLLPALWRARHQARVTRAKVEMKQVETAWISYRNDYRHLPPYGVYNGIMGQNAIDILRGERLAVGQDTYNARRIAYMEFPGNPSEFKDPWGTVYQLRLATRDNPNMLEWPFMGNRRFRLYRPVAVWSIGHTPARPITSW